jgi:hypothetical protein
LMTGKFLCETSHISRLYEKDLTSRNEKEYEEKKRFKTTYWTRAEAIRVRETSCQTRLIVTKQINWLIHTGAAITIGDSRFMWRDEVVRFIRRIDSKVEGKWNVVRILWTLYNTKNSLRTH